MGIFNFIRSQLIEIIEWLDDTNYTLVWRFPDTDNEIKNGAKLVCREGQAAILINEGQLADVFGPGTHTLSTQNMPVLSRLKGWKYGFESPFKVEIYFVSLKQYVDQKWGTPNPVLIRDDEFGVAGRPGKVRIRAFGSYNFKIGDPRRFFAEVVGTSGQITTEAVESFAKSRLVSAFSRAASASKISVADMHAHTDSLASAVKASIVTEFEAVGLLLTSFVIENVSLPPEVEKALDAAAAQAARGVDNTMAWEGMAAMRDVARNPGGTGGAMVNAGLGAGMGIGMGQMFGQAMGGAFMPNAPQGYPPQAYGQQPYAPAQGYAPPPAAAPAAPAADPLQEKLRKLKAAFEADLLTEDEYKAKRAQLLADF
jgi:membrane protease subunit (stomatin/prohibitin family)